MCGVGQVTHSRLDGLSEGHAGCCRPLAVQKRHAPGTGHLLAGARQMLGMWHGFDPGVK